MLFLYLPCFFYFDIFLLFYFDYFCMYTCTIYKIIFPGGGGGTARGFVTTSLPQKPCEPALVP